MNPSITNYQEIGDLGGTHNVPEDAIRVGELEARIHELNNENQILKDRLRNAEPIGHAANLDVIELHRRRFIDIQNEHDDNETLRERIRQLETEVQHLVADNHSITPLKHDYDAALDRLSRYETENKLLRDDRDKCKEQALHYETEGEKLTQQNETLKQQLADRNHTLQMCIEEKDQHETKVRRLGNEVRKFQQESILIKQENEIIKNELKDLKHKYDHERKQYIEMKQTIQEKLRRPLIQNNSINRVPLYDKENDDPSHEVHTQRPTNEDHTTQQLKRKKTFHTSPTRVPSCKNCKAIEPVKQECHFHMCKPQPYSVWRRSMGLDTGGDVDRKDKPNLMFWPCCQKVSQNKPLGCKSLRHHEMVDPLEIEP